MRSTPSPRSSGEASATPAEGQNGPVPATDPDVRPFRAVDGLAVLGGIASCGVGLSAVYAGTGFGLPCPFRMATGWDCPLCGGTRLGGALLRGDVAAAFAFNPVVFVGLVLVSLVGALWTVELLGGPAVRLPGRVAARLRSVSSSHWLAVGLLAATAYVLLRNLA